MTPPLTNGAATILGEFAATTLGQVALAPVDKGIQVVIPLLAEATTTFFLTFWGLMAGGPYSPPPTPKNVSTFTVSFDPVFDANRYLHGVFVPAFQTGLSVWMQIVLFWKISCVHFNPAVSMGFLITGQLKVIMYVPYVIVQCLSAIVASYIAMITLGDRPSIVIIPSDVSGAAVFFNEAIMTGGLIFFAVTMVTDETYDQPTGALAIGLTVFQGALSARWVGVACMNPARAFGPAVVTGGPAWDRHWLLWISDLIGAIVAAGFYMLFFAPKSKRWIFKMKKKMVPNDDRSIATEDTKDNLINETNI